MYICLLYFAGTELNNRIATAVFINESILLIEFYLNKFPPDDS